MRTPLIKRLVRDTVPRGEEALVTEAEAQALRDEAVALLRDLLRIDTSNPPGRETAAAELLARYLEDNGVACELVARDPERANLVARLPGRGSGPSLMLLGHTDVVPADPDAWRHPPFDGFLDDEGYVWGRGALDMKNEVATRAVAMAALARSGERLEGDLVFLAVSDEEDGTNGVGMSRLVEARPDLATDNLIALETTSGHVIYGIDYGRPVGSELVVSVRTVHLGISSERPARTQNVWPVRVEQTVFQGDFTQVHVGWGDQRLVARCAAMEPIAVGREVYLTIEPRRVVLLGE